MHSRLLIISGDFPPVRGGVADHTLRLATELSERFSVSVLTSRGNPVATKFPVHPDITSWTNAVEVSAAIQKYAPEGAIFWQYVPHMYGRGGVNAALPQVMARLRAAGRQQTLIAHEMYSPFSWWPQRSYYAWRHRQQWRALSAAATVLGISTEAWIEQRLTASQRAKAVLLPSPSAIPLQPVPSNHPSQWRRQQGWPEALPVLAFFGSQGGVKQFDWVLEAWRSAQAKNAPVGLVVIGEPPTVEIPAELTPWFKALGYLPPDRVSATLQAADILLLPFSDGVSERRTSFMAGLQHGLTVVSTIGHSTGASLRTADFFIGTPNDNRSAFVQSVRNVLSQPDERVRLGTAAKSAYAAHYDWPVVAQRLAQKAIG